MSNDVSWAKRQRIYDRDGWKCWYCGCDLYEPTNPSDTPAHPFWLPTLDHLTPQALGGTHDDKNLVACCNRCNSMKHRKTLEEYRAYLQAKMSPAWRASLLLREAMAECITPMDQQIVMAIEWLEAQVPSVMFWGEQNHS